MYIFSSSPRNQLPNHGLRTGDQYHWKEIPASASSNAESQQLTGLGLCPASSTAGRRQPTPQAAAWCPSLSPKNQLSNFGN